MIDVEQELLDEIGDLRKELKQYKDIEEELGVDLITYFKIKDANSVCFKKTYFLSKVGSFSKGILVHIKGRHMKLLYKDYGKTWALTKEELEED